MGTWADPFGDIETAERLIARMAEPWIATVTRETSPDFGPLRVGDVHKPGPYGDLTLYRKSGLFRRLKPVAPIGTTESWDWDAEELYHILGNDTLFDALCDEAERRKEDFDIRPFVRAQLREMIDEFGDDLASEEEPEALEMVRALLDEAD